VCVCVWPRSGLGDGAVAVPPAQAPGRQPHRDRRVHDPVSAERLRAAGARQLSSACQAGPGAARRGGSCKLGRQLEAGRSGGGERRSAFMLRPASREGLEAEVSRQLQRHDFCARPHPGGPAASPRPRSSASSTTSFCSTAVGRARGAVGGVAVRRPIPIPQLRRASFRGAAHRTRARLAVSPGCHHVTAWLGA
jgi:hypothetical protein